MSKGNAKTAVYLNKALVRAIRKVAGKETTSAWIADAGRKLRSQTLLDVIGEWENKHGKLSIVDGLLETIDILSDRKTLKGVRRGLADVRAGRVVTLKKAFED